MIKKFFVLLPRAFNFMFLLLPVLRSLSLSLLQSESITRHNKRNITGRMRVSRSFGTAVYCCTIQSRGKSRARVYALGNSFPQ